MLSMPAIRPEPRPMGPIELEYYRGRKDGAKGGTVNIVPEAEMPPFLAEQQQAYVRGYNESVTEKQKYEKRELYSKRLFQGNGHASKPIDAEPVS